MPDRKSPEAESLRALAFVGWVGTVMAASIVGGLVAGIYLDRWLGAHGIVLVVMILAGIAGGAITVYRMLTRDA